MGQFKTLVDTTMALVREKGSVGLAALAYGLQVSPDYARKVAKSAVAVSPDPMEIVCAWNMDTRDPPAICLTSYLQARAAKLKAELDAKDQTPVRPSTPRTGSVEELGSS